MSAEGRHKEAIALAWSIFDGTDYDPVRRDCEVFAAGWLSGPCAAEKSAPTTAIEDFIPPRATAAEHYAASLAIIQFLNHCERRGGGVLWTGLAPELRALLDGTNRWAKLSALASGTAEERASARAALEQYAVDAERWTWDPRWRGHTTELRARSTGHYRAALNAVEPATPAGHLCAANALDQAQQHIDRRSYKPEWAGLIRELRTLVDGTHPSAALPALNGPDPVATATAVSALNLYMADCAARRSRPRWLGAGELPARADAHRLAYAGF